MAVTVTCVAPAFSLISDGSTDTINSVGSVSLSRIENCGLICNRTLDKFEPVTPPPAKLTLKWKLSVPIPDRIVDDLILDFQLGGLVGGQQHRRGLPGRQYPNNLEQLRGYLS